MLDQVVGLVLATLQHLLENPWIILLALLAGITIGLARTVKSGLAQITCIVLTQFFMILGIGMCIMQTAYPVIEKLSLAAAYLLIEFLTAAGIYSARAGSKQREELVMRLPAREGEGVKPGWYKYFIEKSRRTRASLCRSLFA